MSAAPIAARLVVPGFSAVKRLLHEAPRRINVWRWFLTTTNTAATSTCAVDIQSCGVILDDSHAIDVLIQVVETYPL